MNNLFDLFKFIKKEEFGHITYFAETDIKEEKFIDFKYFSIEKDGLIYYIQNATLSDAVAGIYEKFTITPYIKHDFNHKQQFAFKKGFNTFNELIEICKFELIRKEKQLEDGALIPLSRTYKQTIYNELLTYHNTQYGKITLFDYLKKIAGYREKEILKDIDHITMNLNNKDYKVLEFYNKKGQSFAINANNINRLIIS